MTPYEVSLKLPMKSPKTPTPTIIEKILNNISVEVKVGTSPYPTVVTVWIAHYQEMKIMSWLLSVSVVYIDHQERVEELIPSIANPIRTHTNKWATKARDKKDTSSF